MTFYVKIKTIDVIYEALDVPLERGMQNNVVASRNARGRGQDSDDEGEKLNEAVEEDLPNGFD